MGRVAKLIDFVRTVSFGAKSSDAKVDAAGGDIVLAHHFGAPGDDGHPLAGDYVVMLESPQRGGFVVVGYVDPKNAQTAARGERRVYSRNTLGEQVAQIWLKADGTIRADNSAGYFELQPSGVVKANDATITEDGDVITAAGVSLNNHTHAQGPDSAGDIQQESEKPTQ